MKILLGFLMGVSVATAVSVGAECCGSLNVPFDTQLAIEQAQQDAEAERAWARQRLPMPVMPSEPCAR
jgi:hypothetical protein